VEISLGLVSAAFVSFLVIDLAKVGSGLSTAKMLATLEFMEILKLIMEYLGISF
jgi:hypothetical protein